MFALGIGTFDSPSSASDEAPSTLSVIGAGTTFEGTLRVDGDLRIDGSVEGAIEVAENAVVTEGGVMDGEIYAAEVRIAGTVHGDVVATGRLVLTETARVEGTVHADRLIVEEGAELTGTHEVGDVDLDEQASFDGSASTDGPLPELQVPSSDASESAKVEEAPPNDAADA